MTFTINASQKYEIESAAADLGLNDEDLKWRADYSGRGMYGANCVGAVVATAGQAMLLGAAFGIALGDEAAEVLANTRSDNMGYDTIYYWPGVTFDADVELASEDDEDY